MEKRQHTRLALGDKGWRAELTEHISGEKLGEVVNLSPGGLMLLTPTKAGIENLFQVECNVVDASGQTDSFAAGVMVLWQTEASQPGTYWTGLQIIDIDKASQERLQTLHASLASAT